MSVLNRAEQWPTAAGTPLDEARARRQNHSSLSAEHSAAQAELNEDAVIAFLDWMRDQREAAPGTITNYSAFLAGFLDECLRGRPFDVLTPEEVETWLVRPRGGRAKGQPAAPATKARNIAILRSLYKFLTARGYCTRNVAALVTPPKVRNRQPKPIRDETWMDLFTSLPLDARICMGLMYFCGLRRAEDRAPRGGGNRGVILDVLSR